MRTIKELLAIMLENPFLFYHGLCTWASRLNRDKIINKEEMRFLRKYIGKSIPILNF